MEEDNVVPLSKKPRDSGMQRKSSLKSSETDSKNILEKEEETNRCISACEERDTCDSPDDLSKQSGMAAQSRRMEGLTAIRAMITYRRELDRFLSRPFAVEVGEKVTLCHHVTVVMYPSLGESESVCLFVSFTDSGQILLMKRGSDTNPTRVFAGKTLLLCIDLFQSITLMKGS